MKFTARFMLWAVVIFLLTVLTARIQPRGVDHGLAIQPIELASLLELPMQKSLPPEELPLDVPDVPEPARIHLSKRLRLHGTGQILEPIAWIEDRAAQRVGRYVQGDKILDAHLALIGSGMVWLEREGTLTQLRLDSSSAPAPSVPAPDFAGGSPTPISQGSDQDRFSIKTAQQQGVALPGLPVELRSTQTGLLVGSTEGSGWVKRLGLQEGDLILAINGQKLKTPQQTAQVIRKAMHQPSLNISIKRSERLQEIKFRRDLF